MGFRWYKNRLTSKGRKRDAVSISSNGFGTSTWTYEGWQGQVYKKQPDPALDRTGKPVDNHIALIG